MKYRDLHKLAEKSDVASFIFNIKSVAFVYVNPAFISLFNATKEQLTHDYLKGIIYAEDYAYAQKALSDLQNGTLTGNVQIRITANEKVKWIRIMASLSKDDEHDGMIYGNAVDITAEMESQRSFEKYANKKNAVLNILAHDLTGPLSMINMLTSSLKSSNYDRAAIAQIDNIIKINKQATDLIRELTAREFLETADITLAKKRVNISQKVKEYVEEYQKSTLDIKRTFNFLTSPSNIFIKVDEPKFIQILNNLTTNALKFTNENGTITITIEDKGNLVLFSVKDDGIGIPENYMDVLFDKFTDARRKGLQGEPTIGLGMFVIKNIIEWHNGNVWVDSVENKGTTVFFEIPKD
jgi:two-component system sensor histidine kinase VicK